MTHMRMRRSNTAPDTILNLSLSPTSPPARFRAWGLGFRCDRSGVEEGVEEGKG